MQSERCTDTHKVHVAQNRMSSSVDWCTAIVRHKVINGVEVWRIVPQVVLVSIGRPQDTEMLSIVVNPEQRHSSFIFHFILFCSKPRSNHKQ